MLVESWEYKKRLWLDLPRIPAWEIVWRKTMSGIEKLCLLLVDLAMSTTRNDFLCGLGMATSYMLQVTSIQKPVLPVVTVDSSSLFFHQLFSSHELRWNIFIIFAFCTDWNFWRGPSFSLSKNRQVWILTTVLLTLLIRRWIMQTNPKLYFAVKWYFLSFPDPAR